MRPIKFGAISLLLLVATLCLSVLGVLALVTAHADRSLTDMQADSVVMSYRLDGQGEAWVASVDGSLDAAGAGGSYNAGALTGLPAGTTVSGDEISTTLYGDENRTLDITLRVDANGRYSITRWARNMNWTPDTDIGGTLLESGG